MSKSLSIKASDKAIKSYFSELEQLRATRSTNEGQVAPLFGQLLRHYGRSLDYTLIEQQTMKLKSGHIRVDGAMVDAFNFPQGVWEAKDEFDTLEKEIKAKFQRGYPTDNIMFQAPERVVIYQRGSAKSWIAFMSPSSASPKALRTIARSITTSQYGR